MLGNAGPAGDQDGHRQPYDVAHPVQERAQHPYAVGFGHEAGFLVELADGGLGEGLARFDGPAGELPGTAPVLAEQDAVRAVHDHADSEGGVRRRRCAGAGAAGHAFRTAGHIQPVGDRVVRRRGVDRRDRFQGEAVLDQEVFPELLAEDPHVHRVVLGRAGQSQDLGARGHLG